MGVIDLDRPPARRPSRSARTLQTCAAGLAVMIVLGAAGTRSLDHREAQEKATQVEVSVTAETGPDADDLAVGGVVEDGRVTDASLTRRVLIVNTGPLPVDLHSLSADRPGLTLRVDGPAQTLRPGQTVLAETNVTVACEQGLPLRSLPIRIAVRTVDDRDRTAVATLDVSGWREQATSACKGLRG